MGDLGWGGGVHCRQLKAVCENKCSMHTGFRSPRTSGESQPLSQRRVDIAVIFPDRGRIPDTHVNWCYERESIVRVLAEWNDRNAARPPASLREARSNGKP